VSSGRLGDRKTPSAGLGLSPQSVHDPRPAAGFRQHASGENPLQTPTFASSRSALRTPWRFKSSHPHSHQVVFGAQSVPKRPTTRPMKNRGETSRSRRLLPAKPPLPATRGQTPSECLISLVMKGSPVRVRASASKSPAKQAHLCLLCGRRVLVLRVRQPLPRS
jgi:hypothetical protein